MRCKKLKKLLLVPLFLLLAAGIASSGPAAPWGAWLPATNPDGSAHTSIQYRWRSNRPCTPEGCPLEVQIRNTGNAPTQLHGSVYYDTAPLPTEEDARPVIIDTVLKAFGGSRTGSASAGDTTNRLVIAGTRITAVVVEMPKRK